MMKQQTYQEDDTSIDQTNFIACVNGYLNHLDSQGSKQSECDLEFVKKKIKR